MKRLPSPELLSDTQRLLDSLGPLPRSISRPVLIVLSGLPGTGKSHFSRLISDKLSVVILQSDALRKVLFLKPSYSRSESAHLFKASYFLIEVLLKAGISLIWDATNLTECYRKKLYNIAERAKARFILVRMTAPAKIIQKRLNLRKGNPSNLSDADWAVYQSMKPVEDRIHHKHYVVDSSKDMKPIISKIFQDVIEEERQ